MISVSLITNVDVENGYCQPGFTYAVPFLFPTDDTVYNVYVPAGGIGAIAGIYDDAGGYPGQLVLDLGSPQDSINGVFRFGLGLGQTLDRGPLWLIVSSVKTANGSAALAPYPKFVPLFDAGTGVSSTAYYTEGTFSPMPFQCPKNFKIMSPQDSVFKAFFMDMENTTGAIGASGFSGYSGSGVSGYSGQVGISGFSGFTGVSGIQGIQGTSGFSGYYGTSGFTGKSGYSGVSGSGVSGYSGSQGIQGQSGTSGFSAANGLPGSSGTSGFSGFTGVSGLQGTSGGSGFSGSSGVSGFSGLNGAGQTYAYGFNGSITDLSTSVYNIVYTQIFTVPPNITQCSITWQANFQQTTQTVDQHVNTLIEIADQINTTVLFTGALSTAYMPANNQWHFGCCNMLYWNGLTPGMSYTIRLKARKLTNIGPCTAFPYNAIVLEMW